MWNNTFRATVGSVLKVARWFVPCVLSVSLLSHAVSQSYIVLVGDRDQQRGVVAFNPTSNTLSNFGACPQVSQYRLYYGIAIHPRNGTVWACDILAQQIVVLDPNGNCINTIPTRYAFPTGIAIEPSGRYVHVTFQSNFIDCYDIATQSWVATTTVENASSLYGLEWSPGGVLYVCDFGGRQLIALGGTTSLTEVARTSTTYNPYDVAVIHRTGGRAPIDYVYITETTSFYGTNSQISVVGYAYDTPGMLPPPSLYLNHPQTGNGSVSFFGIAYSPVDNTLWVNDYVRGELYQVTVSSTPTATLRYDEPSPYKYGLGVAIARPISPPCEPHGGDVNCDGIIDDTDLLRVLFAFGQSGSNLGRVDVNCDGTVDDADLLIVLFNFGRRGPIDC